MEKQSDLTVYFGSDNLANPILIKPHPTGSKMSFIDYQANDRILVMTKGHPFNRDEFFAVFDAFSGIECTAVEQPASQAFFDPKLAADYQAFVFYDMPGMDFQSSADEDGFAPRYVDPPEQFKNNFLALLEAGHGCVFLHHSIAAWPAWPEYADIVGGKFLYKPDILRGQPHGDSGYRHEVDHEITVLADHPVTRGVDPVFSITDELYLGHVFDDQVVPLISSNYEYIQDNFYSAQQAVQGNMFSREGWQHPPGHNVVGWAKHYGNSPIVYLQCGDSQAAYENPNFQKLLLNAVQWVSSDEAKQWARARH
ncbi:MAG: type 1 glutamine amidotransferase [Halioglobus sp.]